MAELSQDERERIAVDVASTILGRVTRREAFDDIADALPFHSVDEVAHIHAIIANRAKVSLSE